MPAGNGTGPMGTGPMTGRAAGYCTGNTGPGNANAGLGFGRGMRSRGGQGYGRSGGRGMGMRFCRGLQRGGYGMPAVANPPIVTAEQEASLLKTQAQNLENELVNIQKRLADLEAGKQ